MKRTSTAGLWGVVWLHLLCLSLSAADPIFVSGIISDQVAGHAVDIDVDVQGAEMLFLVVTDAGDGIVCDFANWTEPRLITAEGELDLTQLKWVEARSSWGEIRFHRNAEGALMRMAGRRVRGIGTHANSVIGYRLPEGTRRFQARAGLDTQGTEEGLGATVRFLVYTQHPDIQIQRHGAAPSNVAEDGAAVREFTADGFFGAGADATGRATPAESFHVAEGFRAELVYTVPRDTQGSWVSLAVDPQGRLVASDQWKGLYRITLPKAQATTSGPIVERLDVEIGGAQGLLFAHDCLYAVVNGEESGLYRLRDTDQDDRFDQVQLLRRFDGAGEHGPHAVVLAPDGESLYLVGGNDCFPPEFPERSRVPRVWQEDRLLSRTSASDGPWGDNRHGGWICRTDRDARQLELIAMGLRNPYDIAFNEQGELFTFDADMEWDVGTPWYRPTRVNHVISGADFGWRAGTAKWPDYYFDSFGSVVDVGLSSPTGLVFGYQAEFPSKYRQALFMGDWSLGNIYAVHLQPIGASYRGECESFVAGAPLPVTDLVINPLDGAMYFVVGGRGINSALYRISYVGDAETPVARQEARQDDGQASDEMSRGLRGVRRRVEEFHRSGHPAQPSDLWPLLAGDDRALRYAARIALEHLPGRQWQRNAATQTDPRARIAAVLAAARHAQTNKVGALLDSLGQIPWQRLEHEDHVDLLRTYVVLLSRHGREGDVGRHVRQHAKEQLDHLFPTQAVAVDELLAEILVFVESPRIIDRVLTRLEQAETQQSQIHYAMCLRDVKQGWTLSQRRRLFGWFQQTAAQRGGVLFGDYIWQIRSVVEQELTETQRQQLQDVLEIPEPSDPLQSLSSRPLVKKWTADELLDIVDASAGSGDANRGRAMFKSALCLNCHRVQGQGGMVGPDLTSVTRRFNARDLVEAMVEPDKVISEQYRRVQILTDEGKVVSGKITDINGNTLVLMNDALNPADLTMVDRDCIEEMSWSQTSMMPMGLLNTFTSQDVVDLVAYLRSAAPRVSHSMKDARQR